MYDYINREVICNNTVQYLEFGVFKGDSIKYFSSINSDAASRFIGFDTFEGLPEDWIEFSRTVKKSTFSTGGELPQTDDERVSFVKGLFQETLPSFMKEYCPNGQLLIHNDSDLYSATMFVLTYANDILVPGSLDMFDEFYSVTHEFRALEDYCSSYMRSYEVVAATKNHGKIVIKMQ
ncbi:MAG: TylF/MycF/NovP-related O-methyltransferase [Aeoliella sp.]